MSKHSMRNGASGSSSASCNASSARARRVVVRGAPELVPRERFAAFSVRGREELALAAALRHADADLRAAVQRQELLVELGSLRARTGTRISLGTHAARRRRAARRSARPAPAARRLRPCRRSGPCARPRGPCARRTPGCSPRARPPRCRCRSKSSSRLATICWRSIALRTLASWSRTRAASSNSSCVGRVVHALLEPLEHRVVLAVEEVDQLLRRAASYSSWSIAPTHGAAHFSMCA